MRLFIAAVAEGGEDVAIKMRNNNDKDAICCECGDSQSQVLNMFDLCIGGQIFTICDACNEKILSKTLSAEVMKNGRVKSQQDMAIIRKRKTKKRGGNLCMSGLPYIKWTSVSLPHATGPIQLR